MNKAVAAIIVAGVALGGYFAFRPASAPAPAPDAAAPSSVPGGARYTDPSGFSIYIPEGYQATPSRDSGAETILIGKSDGSEPGMNIQIYIMQYDEAPTSFDSARIARDLPSLAPALAHSRGFSIADGHGVEFDDAAGHEIWFAADGQLYQMTAPAGLAKTAEGIAASFKLQ